MKYLIALFFLLFSTALASEHKTLKVAVVDTGLDLKDDRFQGFLCPTGHQDFTGEGLKDTHGHGTHVTGLIEKNAGTGNYCFLILKYYSDKQTGHQNLTNEIKAFNAAVEEGADIVNFSGGGPEFNEEEYLVIRQHPNVKFVVAVGNEKQDIDNPETKYYPASYFLPNEYIVGNADVTGQKSESSNWSSMPMAWEDGVHVLSTLPGGFGYMTGSSQSTAIFTGKLVKAMLK